ncbi:MAG: hypothetical protein IK012_03750 [Fibrobacter sp.]|uniref:hypothetical protein n=1 Tax=Fibrobacter sp. TaxID=35828 RepID=UPI0025C5494D|nr:hypothetical protein [Fibrobacter sp.]MBR4784351.1 hypothetical protein [Fibrobacter sp.]
MVFWAGTTKIVGAPGFARIVTGWVLTTPLCTCLGAVAAASSSNASDDLLRVSAGEPAKDRLVIKPKKTLNIANFRINLPSIKQHVGFRYAEPI